MMAAEHYQQPQFQTDLSSIINYIVTGVFVLEMLVKHCAYGPKYYWTDGTDFFDGMIIFASIVDIVVSNVQVRPALSFAFSNLSNLFWPRVQLGSARCANVEVLHFCGKSNPINACETRNVRLHFGLNA